MCVYVLFAICVCMAIRCVCMHGYAHTHTHGTHAHTQMRVCMWDNSRSMCVLNMCSMCVLSMCSMCVFNMCSICVFVCVFCVSQIQRVCTYVCGGGQTFSRRPYTRTHILFEVPCYTHLQPAGPRFNMCVCVWGGGSRPFRGARVHTPTASRTANISLRSLLL